MIVIGLDLSLRNSGVAIVEDPYGEPLVAQCVKTSTNEILEESIESIRVTIRQLLKEFPPTLAVVENHIFGRMPHASTQIHEVAGVVKNLLYRRHVLTELVAPATLKKFATGSGRAKKPEMIAAAQAIWPRCPRNDNVADAFHLARYGLHVIAPKIQTDV